MAKEHLVSLFSLQEVDGFVGHMIYWDRLIPNRTADIFQSKPSFKNFFRSHMTSLIQPPIVAQAVKRVYELEQDTGFLRDFVPKLKKYYDWLATYRDFDGNNLLTIISPFESGMDWKPTYDVALGLKERMGDWRLFLRVVGVDFKNYINNYDCDKISRGDYFSVKDAGFNAIYADNLKALSSLCNVINDSDAERYRLLSKKVTESILTIMYDEDTSAFYDVYGRGMKKIQILTPTILYPVILDDIPDAVTKQVIDTYLVNGDEFKTLYPLPSVSVNHPSFNPAESIYLWRGPTWVMNNWFIHQSLLKKWYNECCKMLMDGIRNLISKSGFREYYNPLTGEGYGARDFTWSCLIVDMIRARNASLSNPG
jgi:glycogen debranching enzyme